MVPLSQAIDVMTWEQLFRFLSFLAGFFLPWPSDYLIRFWSIFVWSWPWISKVQYEKQTYWLNSRCQMWSLAMTLALTLNFEGQIFDLLYILTKWSDCHGTKNEPIDWTPQMQPSVMTLTKTVTLDFQDRFLNSCISGMAGPVDMKLEGSKFIGRVDWHWTNGM